MARGAKPRARTQILLGRKLGRDSAYRGEASAVSPILSTRRAACDAKGRVAEIVGCRRPPIIQHAVWLYLRFTPSYRYVEELLAERGLDISSETVRCWVLKFAPRSRARALSRRTKRMDGVEKLTVTSVDQLATFYARPSERVLRTPPEQPSPVHAVSAA